MDQESNLPKSESELRILLDNMYVLARKNEELGTSQRFKGLLEIVTTDVNILTAIHKLKGNKGSRTPGSDERIMEEYILQRGYSEVLDEVKRAIANYKPAPVRRVYIPKPGSNDMRPLGIPTILDRIIQECVRAVIEPIMEAQFFEHSYGFRPMRDAHMAIGRVNNLIHQGYVWVIEGDIRKFFDNVNHRILIQKMWHMGIKDRRILMIVKEMLKAGVMNETRVSELGTPQGGIISPLLANIYLHSLDQWITREWENKETKNQYHPKSRTRALHRTTYLKPAYYVRYADDWVLFTKCKEDAEKWKYRIEQYLKNQLKLELSVNKTVITKVTNSPMKFLGFELKAGRGKSVSGYIVRSRPEKKRIDTKVEVLRKKIKELRKTREKEFLIHRVNETNSIIRGMIEYYSVATRVHETFQHIGYSLLKIAMASLSGYGGKWVTADSVDNLRSIHGEYKTKIVGIEYNQMLIGLTSLGFCKWKQAEFKKQNETPYTEIGRDIYKKRTGNKRLIARADQLLKIHLSKMIAIGMVPKKYNFEYFLNRAYAFNRDKGKCRVCSGDLNEDTVHIHHVNPKLPLSLLNKVNNLASMHNKCHEAIHSNSDFTYLGTKVCNKINKFREKLKN